MQPFGVQDHFSQNVLKFGFGDGKNVYEKGGNSIFFTDLLEFGFVDGKMRNFCAAKKVYRAVIRLLI